MNLSNLKNNKYLKQAVSFLKTCGEYIINHIPTMNFRKINQFFNSKPVRLSLSGLTLALLMLQSVGPMMEQQNVNKFNASTVLASQLELNSKATSGTQLSDNSMLLCVAYNSAEKYCSNQNIDPAIVTHLENSVLDTFANQQIISSSKVTLSEQANENEDAPTPSEFASTLLDGLDSLAEAERRKKAIQLAEEQKRQEAIKYNTSISPANDDEEKNNKLKHER